MTLEQMMAKRTALIRKIGQVQANGGSTDELVALVDEAEGLDAQIKAAQLTAQPRPTPSFRADGMRDGSGPLLSVARPGSATPLVSGPVREALAAIGRYVKSGGLQAAMTIGGAAGAEGGFTVPTTVDAQLLGAYANQSPLFALARRREGVTAGFRFPVATGLPAVGWVAETGTRTATDTPTFAEVLPPNGGIYANASATQWLLQDTDYDLGSWIVGEIGRAQGQAIGAALAAGDGTNKPKGLTVYTHATTADAARAFGSIQYVPGGAVASLNIDAAISAFYALQPEFQLNSSWIMSPTAAETLRKQKSSSGGDYMWTEPQAGQPALLVGRPVHIDVNLPAVSGTNVVAYIGDWQRAYGVTVLGQAIFIVDPYTSKGSVLTYSERRIGGALLDSCALKAVKCGTT